MRIFRFSTHVLDIPTAGLILTTTAMPTTTIAIITEVLVATDQHLLLGKSVSCVELVAVLTWATLPAIAGSHHDRKDSK